MECTLEDFKSGKCKVEFIVMETDYYDFVIGGSNGVDDYDLRYCDELRELAEKHDESVWVRATLYSYGELDGEADNSPCKEIIDYIEDNLEIILDDDKCTILEQNEMNIECEHDLSGYDDIEY